MTLIVNCYVKCFLFFSTASIEIQIITTKILIQGLTVHLLIHGMDATEVKGI